MTSTGTPARPIEREVVELPRTTRIAFLVLALGPIFAAMLTSWFMGAVWYSEPDAPSFATSLAVALAAAMLLAPVAAYALGRWRAPRLVIEPQVLKRIVGRRVVGELAPSGVASFEERRLELAGRLIARWVVATMVSGTEVPLELPTDVRLPGFHDRTFDRRLQELEVWRAAAVER